MKSVNTGERTFVDFGTERLSALCVGVGAGAEASPLIDVFQRLVRPWGSCRMGANPRYRSNVSDDHAPFEFAIGLSGGAPEVQAYVDVQSPEATLQANTVAARVLLESVAPTVGASLARLRKLESLFLPDEPAGPFALWIGASWMARRGVRLKAYLNPAVRGSAQTVAVVEEAFGRLGFERAWRNVAQALRHDGPRRDELAIVSLDLSASEDARIKLYIRHHRGAVRDIDAVARLATDYREGCVSEFYRTLAGDEGPYLAKPALTELAFTDPHADRPASVTLEFPIGSYVETDQVAAERIRHCLTAYGLSTGVYDEAIRCFATRALGDGSGIHAHVTLRWVRESPRIGIYLASEAYASASKEG